MAKKSNAQNAWSKEVPPEANYHNYLGLPYLMKSRTRKLGKSPKVADLFCGCGGFACGFTMAGFESALGIDILTPALETFAHNNPHANVVLGDIRKLSEAKLIEYSACEQIDVLTGGVPCQGFSRSNRKRNENDERNFLFKEFIRAIRVMRPKVVVLENVSGLATTADGAFKKAISESISKLGYDVYCKILNAADYGVPQKRHRIFFVGVPKKSKWLWPMPSRGTPDKPHFTVADAILEDLPKLESGEISSVYTASPANQLAVLLRGDCIELTSHEAPSHPQSTINRIAKTPQGKPMYGSFKQRIRLDALKPSPTQICGGIRPQFQFGHPTQARGLTIRERARLQSFPDRYKFFGGIVQGRVQTGNAVPPLLAKALASQIKALLSGGCKVGITPDEILNPELELE